MADKRYLIDIRKEFPLLVARPGLVYLDNAATTQKPAAVLDTERAFYEEADANIHRGIYALSEEASDRYERAREKVARFLNAPSAENIVFTAGATDSINLVAHSWGLANLERGDEILLTPLEHHANIVPWQQVAKQTGAKVVFCGLKEDFTLDVDDLKRRITPKTGLLAITQVSNVLGIATPLSEIIPYAKQRGVTVLVDGAQGAPHLKTDVQALGCDFYAFSGHKMLAPTGIGVLYVAEQHRSMQPYRTGGDMIEDVTEQGAEFAPLAPRRLEAGTPHIAGAVGLGAAIDYLESIGMDAIHQHEAALLKKAWHALSRIPDVTLLGPAPENDPLFSSRSAVVSFTVEGIHPHDVAQLLDDEGVCIRVGKHCAHPLHARMKVAATNRASFYLYNTEQDIDALVAALRHAIEVFR